VASTATDLGSGEVLPFKPGMAVHVYATLDVIGVTTNESLGLNDDKDFTI